MISKIEKNQFQHVFPIFSLFTTLAGSLGGLESKASEQGMDPNLISTVMGLIGGGGSGGSEGGSGGFDLGSLLEIAKVIY